MKKPVVVALALMMAQGAFAQETTTPEAAPEAAEAAPAEGAAPAEASPDALPLGEEVKAEGVGTTYIAEESGAWAVRCVRAPEGQTDPCQLYQLLRDEAGNSVAEISIFELPQGQEAAAGATIVTPLETLLSQQVTIQVDSGQAKRYPFTWCSQIGCIARVGFTNAEVEAFKKGNKATITIVPVAAPDQKVNLNVSLSGFTAGYAAANKASGN